MRDEIGPQLPTVDDCQRAVQNVLNSTAPADSFSDAEVCLAWTFVAHILHRKATAPPA